MNNKPHEKFARELSEIMNNYNSVKNYYEAEEGEEGIFEEDYFRLKTRAIAAIKRIVSTKSEYHNQLQEILNKLRTPKYKELERIMAIVKALYEDISGGFLIDLEEMVRGELFSDYLEQAEYLLSEGYKDAAAVIAGSTLEQHLRKVCVKNEIMIYKDGEKTRYKKTNMLKDELASKGIISTTFQKQITLWLDVRNNAAHGNYEEYSKDLVEVLIQGIKSFIITM